MNKSLITVTMICFLIFSAVALFSDIKISGSLTNAGSIVNSGGDEFSPSMTADGGTIVFNAKKPGNNFHNIYMIRNTAGSWDNPVPIEEVNSKYNDETPFISADGNTIIFSSDRPGGNMPPVTSDGRVRITYDLYISRKFNDKWSEPQLLNSDINTIWNERSPSISRDGKTFFFTRWPYMNMGRSGIFMADITKDGIRNVRKLPESINSGNYEIAFIPSYKSKEEKYYFSSAREGGYGGWDIYYTIRKNDQFTNPVNAGPMINSAEDDLYFIDGMDFSLICSNRKGGNGGFDIYISGTKKIEREVVKQTLISAKGNETWIKVTPYNVEKGEVIKNSRFKILLHTCDKEGCGVTRTTERISNERGFFIVRPKPDVKYIFIESSDPELLSETIQYQVIPDNYQEITVYFNRSRSGDKPVSAEYTGETPSSDFILKNIYFPFNSSKISTSYYPYLYSIVHRMRENRELKLTVSGHSDKRGSRRANYAVSMKRAENVSDFISGMGIDKSRIRIVNHGDSRPVKGGISNDMDRRVEFSFTE